MICVVDPASRNAALTLWNNGTLLHYCILQSNEKTWGKRLNDMRLQIIDFFAKNKLKLEDVSLFLIEDVRSRVVGLVGGVYLSLFPNAEFSEKKSLIAVSSWKAFIRKVSGEKDPKGLKSLENYLKLSKSKIKFDKKWTEDVCDSIMMALYFFSTKGDTWLI